MDIDKIMLDMVRKNPLDFLTSGDMWLFNFALLNFDMKTYGLRLNPKQGTDETVADWLTVHKESVADYFQAHYTDTDYFLPIEI